MKNIFLNFPLVSLKHHAIFETEKENEMKIGYARVSTKDQVLDLQLDALNKAGCEVVHKDTGISGSTSSRPGLDSCLASLKAGDCLVVWKLDRLGRSLEHVMSLMKQFEERGVDFKSITEGFDTTTPAGKLLFHIIGSLAQFERELIRERVMAGLEAAKANGKKLGRKFTIKPEDVSRAVSLYQGGKSFGEVAAELGISRASAHRIVRKHIS